MLIEKLIREEIDAINKGDLEAVCGYYTDDVVFLDISAPDQPAVGMAAFKEAMRAFFTAFPDMHIEITRIFSDPEGKVALAEYSLQGTQQGPMGDLAPTNRFFKVMAASVYELRGDKFCKETLYWDTASVFKQLGL
ncbi:MAG: ester cyclase [Bacillota bacterium]